MSDEPAGFPEPTEPRPSRADVLLGYLDYLRQRVIDKVSGLPPGEATLSRLPSGWTPLQLLNHLTHVERRWLEWGFAGQQVDDPFGDARDGAWLTARDDVGSYVRAAQEQAVTTTRIVDGQPLDVVGRPGPRWDGAAPPTLERVLLHLVQEFARHLGQLDVVAELAGGPVGE